MPCCCCPHVSFRPPRLYRSRRQTTIFTKLNTETYEPINDNGFLLSPSTSTQHNISATPAIRAFQFERATQQALQGFNLCRRYQDANIFFLDQQSRSRSRPAWSPSRALAVSWSRTLVTSPSPSHTPSAMSSPLRSTTAFARTSPPSAPSRPSSRTW